MRKRFAAIISAALCLLFLFPFTACGESGKLIGYTSYAYFNTSAVWAFRSENGKETDADAEVWEQIKTRLGEIENSVSSEAEESSIARFNRAAAGETVQIDGTAYALLLQAKEMYVKTEGAYNPAVGLLVDLWGFSPRFTGTEGAADPQPYDTLVHYDSNGDGEEDAYKFVLPQEKYLTAFRNLSDFSAVELFEKDGEYFAKKPNTAFAVVADETGTEHTYTMQLNLGGIGKGYAVDEAERLIRAAGYRFGYFNLGASSMCVLRDFRNKDETWEIGLGNPRLSERFPASEYGTVKQTDISLSSSGDYEQYHMIEGRRHCHIINPFTGYPINAQPQNAKGSGIIVASVFGLSAAEGDATTTALMVMGKEKALAYLAEKLPEKQFVFIYYNGEDDSYTVYTNMNDSSLFGIVSGMATEKI